MLAMRGTIASFSRHYVAQSLHSNTASLEHMHRRPRRNHALIALLVTRVLGQLRHALSVQPVQQRISLQPKRAWPVLQVRSRHIFFCLQLCIESAIPIIKL